MKTALILFAKAPVPGHSKTRLIPALGEEEAARVHELLVLRTLDSVAKLSTDSGLLVIQMWGSAPHPKLELWSRQYGWPLIIQQGVDLGERMSHALTSVLEEGVDKAVLIGSDCPMIDAHYVTEAINALDSSDVVLGPAEDGGYVLVGCRRGTPKLFNGIDWGTDRVLEQTVGAASDDQLRLTLLDTLWDVDKPEDWERFSLLLAAEKD